MSPFLPTLRTSSRRITFTSLLLGHRGVVEPVTEHALVACLGGRGRRAGRARRRAVGAAGATGPAVAGRPLGGDAAGVREQGHLAGVLDGARHLTLLLSVVPRHAAGADLGPV